MRPPRPESKTRTRAGAAAPRSCRSRARRARPARSASARERRPGGSAAGRRLDVKKQAAQSLISMLFSVMAGLVQACPGHPRGSACRRPEWLADPAPTVHQTAARGNDGLRDYGDTGCRRSEPGSGNPSRFRVISRACEEENFPPLLQPNPKRSLPLTGHDPIERRPEVHPSDAAPVCGGWVDEGFAARRRQTVGLEPSEAIPFPGADPVFSGFCGAICRLAGASDRERSLAGQVERPREGVVAKAFDLLGVRGFRGHTISQPGSNLFKPLLAICRRTGGASIARELPAESRVDARAPSLRRAIPRGSGLPGPCHFHARI